MTASETTGELLRHAARRHPNRDAYVHGDERITYAQLDTAADRMASRLVESGVRPGDVVCVVLASSIRFAVAYLGGMRAGAVTSAINLRLGEHERSSILARTEPRVVVDGGWGWEDWNADTAPDALAALPDIDAADVACLVWTSGTTGVPKGAVYDHVRLAAISRNMGALTEPGDRRLSVLPFPHVGYMTRIWDEIANGTTLVLAGEPWSPAETLRLVREEDVTVMTGVPTQWTLLLEHPDLAITDFGRVRLVGIGGAPVDPDLVRRIRATLGAPVLHRYTSTESGLGTGTRLDDEPEVVATTVGRAAPEVELRIVDSEGLEIARGDVGEVTLRSPAMMREYWRDPEQTAAVFDERGFLHTGDLGAIGEDGNLRLVGRSKEMYVRGGYNVYPVEVERVLVDHPAVAQAAVVGMPDPVLGEIGVAFVVVDVNGDAPDGDGLTAWVRGRLADYKAPDRLVVLDALPVTSMHKIDKRALTERAKEEP